MAKQYWQTQAGNRSYCIEMFHGGFSGKVIVYTNDRKIIEGIEISKNGDMIWFTIDDHQFLIYAKQKFLNMKYALIIDNRSVETGEIQDYFEKFQKKKEEWDLKREKGRFSFVFWNGIFSPGHFTRYCSSSLRCI